MIKIGNDKIGAVYHGGTPISKIYKGGELVYSAFRKGVTLVNKVSGNASLFVNGAEKRITVEANVPCFVEIQEELTSLYKMFKGWINLTSVTFHNLDTSNVTDIGYAFNSCSSLTSLDLSSFHTPNLKDVGYTFAECSSLTSLDLSNFDISNVNTIGYTFKNCSALTHIKCKREFMNWAKVKSVNLPAAMQEGGSGTWEIVD